MSDNHLHIISFDVPYPANYGGVIDVFYRIKALSEAGVKVHLHCYEYGRGRQAALERLCYEVLYYKRDMSSRYLLGKLPYIVATRNSNDLANDLLKDDYPVLCEGLHSTAVLLDKRLKDRKIYVRAHNVEHDYYQGLGQAERSFWKRLYYRSEASKLRRYEPVLNHATGVFAITQKDADYFASRYKNVSLLPAFNASDSVCVEEGRGDYVLYHGNLSVRENADAAEWLIEEVFSKLDCHCIVAGMNPPDRLIRLAKEHANVTLSINPDDAEMIDLLRNAQVNVLVTDQPTGLKLKLLNALYNGRFCLVNPEMVKGTGLEPLCIVHEEPEAFIAEINRLMKTDFTEDDVKERDEQMQQLYRNETNVKTLIEKIFH